MGGLEIEDRGSRIEKRKKLVLGCDISRIWVLISMGGVFEDRLIIFANLVLSVCDAIRRTEAENHLRSQLIRSGTSVALNYGEAQSAESKKDQHHKLSVILKELRETYINLKIIRANGLCNNMALLEKALDENNQLIAIFVKSIQTVRRKLNLN